MFRTFCCLLFFISAQVSVVCAQAISNVAAYKNISNDGYFRLSYDNDFFVAIDEYYTQGIDIELVSPQFQNFFVNKVLINPRYSYVRYGMGLQHNGYTPSSISSDYILINDRPFAGCILFKTFLIAINPVNNQRFSSSFYIGMIGPLAGTRQMQEGIHKALANIMPHGWQHQIQNDVALNYQIDYEKQILGIGKYLSVSGAGSLSLGTLSCKGGVAGTLMAGYFSSPYSDVRLAKNEFSIYLYERPEVNLIGCDATMQGGMFNRNSPYIVTDSKLNRFTFRNRFGIVVAYRKVYLEYFLAVVSKEFNTGKQHGYGGVQIGLGI
ncbi:MAG: lipid A deacylase LpxR family protein [Taibaiella sp.]|nr:lipid A deacylase LpxR family protein [Taibaiella sp.]